MNASRIYFLAILVGLTQAVLPPPTAEAQILKRLKEKANETEAVLKKVSDVVDAVGCVFDDVECIEQAEAENKSVVLTDAAGNEVTGEQAATTSAAGTTGGSTAAGATGGASATSAEYVAGPSLAAVDRQLMGTAPKRHNEIIQSPDGSRIAWVTLSGSRFAAVIDGEMGPPFDELVAVQSHFRIKNPIFLFSKDGSRVAYVGRSGSEYTLVLDGVSGPTFSKPITHLAVSENGARLVYVSAIDGEQGDPQVQVVIDGEPVTKHRAVHGLGMSPTGRFVVLYTEDASETAARDFHQYVLDGRKVISRTPFMAPAAYGAGGVGRARFTAADQAYAYIERVVDGGSVTGERVVHNGMPGKTYASIIVDGDLGGVHLSDDGQRVAYVASLDGGPHDAKANASLVLVIDGQEKTLEGRSVTSGRKQRGPSLFVSSDGKRYAFERAQGTGGQYVVDGIPGPEYRAVANFVFSPDGRRYLYTATQPGQSSAYGDRGKHFVIVDDSESEAYDGIDGNGLPFFSADGKRYAYVALDGKETRIVVIDGKAVGKYGDVSSLTFSPDGSRAAFLYLAREGGNWDRGVYLEGKRTPFGTVSDPGAVAFSPDGKRFALLRGFYTTYHNVQLIVNDQEHPAFGKFGSAPTQPPVFSSDGKYVVYPASDPQTRKAFFVINGTIAPGDVRVTTSAGTLGQVFLPDGRLQYYSLEDGQLFRYRVTLSG